MDTQSIKNRFGIIGNAPALNHALDVAQQVAPTDLTVLIVGESGVGKEVFSNVIHALSPRKHNSFIAVNCGAIPEGTIDSELFGHEKGAFTGAVESRKGYFETVNGGTIFLDEIGEMPLGTQARLLRVLETGEFIRVGSSKVQKTDVRVITATNRDLLDWTRQGKFREDLYFRLSTVPIRVPALRDRQEDILLLFRKFTSDFAERYRTRPVQLDAGAQQVLLSYNWPGNVRELKNVAEQMSVLAADRTLSAPDMQRFLPQLAQPQHTHSYLPTLSHMAGTSGETPFSSTERDLLYKVFFELKRDMHEVKQLLYDMAGDGHTRSNHARALPQAPEYEEEIRPYARPEHTPVALGPAAPVLLPTRSEPHLAAHEEVEESLNLAEREKELIIKALKKHRGRRRDAAQELGISERTLYRKIKEYDIEE